MISVDTINRNKRNALPYKKTLNSFEKKNVQKYITPDEIYHSSRNHIKPLPAPNVTLLQIHPRDEQPSPAQPQSNTSAEQQGHHICDEQGVEDLLGEKGIISNLGLTDAESFLLWVLELPVLWRSLIWPAAPVPNPIGRHGAINTSQISVLNIDVHTTQVILRRQLSVGAVWRRFGAAAWRNSGRALIAFPLRLPQQAQVLVRRGRAAQGQLQLQGLGPLGAGARAAAGAQLHPGLAQGILAAGDHPSPTSRLWLARQTNSLAPLPRYTSLSARPRVAVSTTQIQYTHTHTLTHTAQSSGSTAR